MLAEILHQIASMENEEQDSRKYYPRPSGAGSERCIRQMVYDCMGVAGKVLPGRTLHVFNDGNWQKN